MGSFLLQDTPVKHQKKYDGLVFKTTLRRAPQQFKDTDTYFLNFDSIGVVNDKDDALKNSFNKGGTLFLTANKLPQDASIGKGTKNCGSLKRKLCHNNVSSTTSVVRECNKSRI